MMRFSNSAGDELALCGAGPATDLVTLAVELKGADVPPEWIELIPAGRFKPDDHRPAFLNDRPDEAIAASRLPAPIDYDHGTQRSGISRAAGWIDKLENRLGAIWGHVEWTKAGREAVAAKEYRYISPAFMPSKDAILRVLWIAGAGLVNNPALPDLPALAAKEENTLDLAKLRKLLGLPETATEAEIMAALEALCQNNAALASSMETVATAAGLTGDQAKKPNATAITAICTKLKASTSSTALLSKVATAAGLSGDAAKTPGESEVTAICARLTTANGTGDIATLSAELTKMTARVLELENTNAGQTAEQKVDAAIKALKVAPGSRDEALALCRRDPAGFDAFIAKAPAILPSGRVARTGDPGGGNGALDTDALAVCSQMGVSPDAFKVTDAALNKQKEGEA
jgi:phage I-like protein